MGQLDGKVAIVTGAGGGLGEAHALLLAKREHPLLSTTWVVPVMVAVKVKIWLMLSLRK